MAEQRPSREPIAVKLSSSARTPASQKLALATTFLVPAAAVVALFELWGRGITEGGVYAASTLIVALLTGIAGMVAFIVATNAWLRRHRGAERGHSITRTHWRRFQLVALTLLALAVILALVGPALMSGFSPNGNTPVEPSPTVGP